MRWRVPPTDPGAAGRPSRLALRILVRIVRPLTRLLFRPSLHGLEHLPVGRPYLLVGNHSAGVGLAEILCIAGLFAESFGGTRRIAAFVHPANYTNPVTAWLQDQLGSIPSTYSAAEAALADGAAILVFPGGDHETLRPIWQVHRVDFNDRRGFLRIARAAGVPIVPLGIRGSHWTAPLLVRWAPLATLFVLPRLLGLKRWGISVLGLLVSLALWCTEGSVAAKVVGTWLALGTPLGFAPFLPATITLRIGPALEPSTLFSGDDPELERAYGAVVTAVQDLVDGDPSR